MGVPLSKWKLIPDASHTVAYTFEKIPKNELEPVDLVARVSRKKEKKVLAFKLLDLDNFASNIILQRQGDTYGYSLERILCVATFCITEENSLLQPENIYQWLKNKDGMKLLVIEAKGKLGRVYLIVCPYDVAGGREWV